MLVDDASFEAKLKGVVAMVRNGLSAMDGLLTENILGSWAMSENQRYEEIAKTGELMALPLLNPFWVLLEQNGIYLTQEQKQVLYDDFWNN